MEPGDHRVKQIKADSGNYHVFSCMQGLDLFKGCKGRRGTTCGSGRDSKSRDRETNGDIG